MGANGSSESEAPFNEHFYGLVNFGNTCYVNSVLQALYFCKPFREKIIQYKINSSSKQNLTNNSTNTNSINLNINGNTSSNMETSSNSLNSELTNVANNSANSNKSDSKLSINNVSTMKQEHLLNCLSELFYTIVTMKKKKGIVQPKKFIARLRKDNESFDNLFQQDAHEFLNYLLNTCADILKAEMKEMRENEEQIRHHNEPSSLRLSTKFNRNKSQIQINSSANNTINSTSDNNHIDNFTHGSNSKNSSNRSINSQNSNSKHSTLESISPKIDKSASKAEDVQSKSNTNKTDEDLTWIHELFQGILVNETRCLNCDTSSSKEENFLDLSVDVDQNTSISNCLKEFSNMEMLCGECKYYCENCASKQEAEKRMRIKKLPKILALHLKRFKYVGVQNKFKKLTYRVVFPFELRLFNTTEDCNNSDRVYDLVSFVVHCGMGLNRGHYISVVKSHGYWFLFDDEQVEKIDVANFEEFYGLTQDTTKKSETCYILFYESRENK